MHEPAVTVVIPFHNAEEWIEETLYSVVRQDSDTLAYEIVLVDDGSTDHTVTRAVNVLKDRNLHYTLIQLKRGGISRARNAGWRASTSEWIRFLDSDDILAPGRQGEQFKMAKAAPESVAVIYSEWQRYGIEGCSWQPIGQVESPLLGENILADLLATRNFLATGSTLLRRRWLEQIDGYDESLDLIEDVHLLLRIAMAGGAFRAVSVGSPLLFYRQRAKSLSRGRPLEFARACIRNCILVEEYWRSRGVLNETLAIALTQLYESPLRTLAEYDQQDFERLLSRIRHLNPTWQPAHTGVRLLSNFVGYRSAEAMSVKYRKAKRMLTRVH